ncbi:MAG TPA: hypothetical protein VIG29_14200, partial [Vicinamibacteria bacterium]
MSRQSLLAVVAVALFACALLDLSFEFGFFGTLAARSLFALAAVSFLYFLYRLYRQLPSSSTKDWAFLLLHLGACASLGIRAFGGEESPFRAIGAVHEASSQDALERASATSERFRDLTGAAIATAESVARDPYVEEAIE